MTDKPCPFCGANPKFERLGGPGSTYTIASCSRCKCDLGFYPTVEMAHELWNKRHSTRVYKKGKPGCDDCIRLEDRELECTMNCGPRIDK